MNIFVSSYDPRMSAKNLDDKRVIKMVLETAQLISGAIHHRPEWDKHVLGKPYKLTHSSHPVSVWVRQDIRHFRWLIEHFHALHGEYRSRYEDRLHASFLRLETVSRPSSVSYNFEFCNCTPYPNHSVFQAYRCTLRDKWAEDKRRPTWYGNPDGGPSWR